MIDEKKLIQDIDKSFYNPKLIINIINSQPKKEEEIINSLMKKRDFHLSKYDKTTDILEFHCAMCYTMAMHIVMEISND